MEHIYKIVYNGLSDSKIAIISIALTNEYSNYIKYLDKYGIIYLDTNVVFYNKNFKPTGSFIDAEYNRISYCFLEYIRNEKLNYLLSDE